LADSFFTELKRRNVFKVGIAYLVMAWVVIQIADVIVPALSLPDWTITFLVVVGLFGLPFALFFAWAFEITPEGIKKETDIAPEDSLTTPKGRKLDYIIIVTLVIIIGGMFFTGSFKPSSDEDKKQLTTQAENKSVAVLPFVNMSSDQEQEWFADGLTEEILNSLAMLNELQVTARTSSFYFKGKNLPVPEIAKKLGVSYIVEGSVRRNDVTLRITAQLIRASDGSHLWSNTYDRPVSDVLNVQENVAESIAQALDVVLDDKRRAEMFASGTRDVAAFESFHKGIAYSDSVHNLTNDNSLWQANVYFLEAIKSDPKFAAPYLDIQDAYTHFLMEGSNSVFLKNLEPEGLTDEEAFKKIKFYQKKAAALINSKKHKYHAQISQIFISDDWRGLRRLLSELRQDPTLVDIKDTNVWLVDILDTLGMAEFLLPQLEEIVIESPYSRVSWYYLIRHLIVSGEYERAGKLIEQTKEYDFYDDGALISLSIARNNQAKLKEIYELKMSSGQNISGKLYAAIGMRKEALQSLENSSDDIEKLEIYHLLGLYEDANMLASKIDKRAIGALIFAIQINGEGNVLASKDSAPNFVRRLRQAGLSEEKINSMFVNDEH
jgi:TolB-like protein